MRKLKREQALQVTKHLNDYMKKNEVAFSRQSSQLIKKHHNRSTQVLPSEGISAKYEGASLETKKPVCGRDTEHVHRLLSAAQLQKSKTSSLYQLEIEADNFLKNTIRAEKAYTYRFKKSLPDGQLKTLFAREMNQKKKRKVSPTPKLSRTMTFKVPTMLLQPLLKTNSDIPEKSQLSSVRKHGQLQLKAPKPASQLVGRQPKIGTEVSSLGLSEASSMDGVG